MATSGPGAIHLLNGLYDAKMDHVPVLAIVGQVARISLGTDFQQEVNLVSLFSDVASAYTVQVSTPAGVRQAIDRGMRIAIATRSPTCVIIPKDVQEMDAEAPPHKHGAVFTGSGYVAPKVVPVAEDLDRAAEILNEGKRVAILVGAGCLGAGDRVLQTADRLGAGIAKALLGKAVCPDDAPGVISLRGEPHRRCANDLAGAFAAPPVQDGSLVSAGSGEEHPGLEADRGGARAYPPTQSTLSGSLPRHRPGFRPTASSPQTPARRRAGSP